MNGMFGINVTLITHSPFVLSDIPSENILCLSRSKEDELQGNTFAANIHDLFNNTFFLPYTVGELARKEIREIVDFYHLWMHNKHNRNRWRVADETLEQITERKWAKMRYISSIVGDEYLYDEVKDMLDEIEEGMANEED